MKMNVHISENIRARLDAIKAVSQSVSVTDVLRKAIAVYDYIWQEKTEGAKIYVKTKNGEMKEIIIL